MAARKPPAPANPKSAPAAPAPTKARAATKAKASPAKASPAKAKASPPKVKPSGAAAAKAAARSVSAPSKPPSKAAAAATPPRGGAEGTRVPDFSLPDQDGKLLTLAALRGQPFVLYFYPRDDTPGCTREACDFRDAGRALAERGVRVVGVSGDGAASHQRFRTKYQLPFTLLSDPERTLTAALGAYGPKKLYGKETIGVIRSTFLVDGEGVVRKAWRGVKVDGHVARVLDAAALL